MGEDVFGWCGSLLRWSSELEMWLELRGKCQLVADCSGTSFDPLFDFTNQHGAWGYLPFFWCEP